MAEKVSFSAQHQKWEHLKQRLEYAKQLVNSVVKENSDHEQILESRAQKLAVKLDENIERNDYNELVLCRLGKEQIAIETQFVREVLPVKTITPVPGLPKIFKGITNIRGEIITVIDLALFLGIMSESTSEYEKLVVLHSQQSEFAVLINELIGIEQIPLPYESVKVATLQNNENTFLKTITSKNTIAVLDIEKLMASPLLQVNQISENE